MISALGRRVRTLRGRIPPDGWAMVAIVAVIAAAQCIYLLDLSDPNPLGPRSGIAQLSSGFVGGSPTIDPNNGYTSQALGHRAMLDVIHLKLPWWNPYEGTGAPLAGEMQSASLFAPTLLTLVSNGQLYERMLLEMVGGIATYLLLRRLALGRWACLAGGVAFALNGTFSWFAHATVNPVAFLPLLLLGVERAYSASAAGRRGGWRLIAVAGALSFYAGFPEVAYIDTVLAVLWFGWRLGCLPRTVRGTFLVRAAAGALVGTLLSGPLIIAGLDYIGWADLGTHTTGLLGAARFPPQALPQLVMPYIYGPIFDYADPRGVLTGIWGATGGYLTIVLLMFAALGLCSGGRRGLRIVLVVWIVLAFARMYGQIPLLGDVLGLLPGIAHVAFFRYATSSLELAVIVLAALGVDDAVRVAEHRRRVLWAALVSLAVIAVAAIGAHSLGSQLGAKYASRHYFAAAIGWSALTVVAGALAALRVRGARTRGAALALVIAVDAVAMFATPELSAPRSVAPDQAPVAFLQRHLGAERMFTLGPLAPNYGSYFGLPSLNVNDTPVPSKFEHYVDAHLDPYVDPTVFVGNLGGDRSLFLPSPEQELLRNLAGYRAAGVAYVSTPAGHALPQSPSTFRLVDRTPTTWIYHLAGAAPLFSSADPRCAVRTASVTTATVSCPVSTRVVYRETDMPGWSATVGKSAATVHSVDGLFQAVDVPAGTHTITFDYAPPGVLWGWLGFAAGLLVLVYQSIRPRRGRGLDGIRGRPDGRSDPALSRR